MRRSLTKQERLRTRRQIDRVFEAGRKATCKGMRLAYAPNEIGHSRLAVIPARGHKNAVDRNKSRRLAREVFRSVKERVLDGYDFAIVCFPGDYRYADRQEQLLHLLSREQLLRDTPSDQN